MWETGDPVGFQNWIMTQIFSAQHKCFCLRTNKGTFCDYRTANNKYPKIASTEKGSLHPYLHYRCSAMLLENLNTPHWISIQCNSKIIGNVICQIKNTNTTAKIDQYPSSQMCSLHSILNNRTCYTFCWVSVMQKPVGIGNSRHVDVKDLEFIFDAVDVSFPPICTQDCQHVNVFKRFLTQYQYSANNWSGPDKHALFALAKDTQYFPSGGNVFICTGSNSTISFVFVCNDIPDCLHQDDENDCNNGSPSPGRQQTQCSCLYPFCNKGKCSLFLQWDISGEQKENEGVLSNISCRNASEVPLPLIDDLVSDCTSSEIDEVQLTQTNLSSNICSTSGLLPCVFGHTRCYNISSVCVFKLNQYGHLTPCRAGQHLYNCQKYECNAMFRCPKFYCIPWKYVCDGKWDCPHGTDELKAHNCGKRLCRNMFLCVYSQVCVHMASVCDGVKECPHGDDEYHCSLWEIQCPDSCECIMFSVKCINLTISQTLFSAEKPFYFVQIIQCSLPTLWNVRRQQTFISFVLKHCKLPELCHLTVNMRNVLSIDVSFNTLHQLPAYCFQYQLKMKLLSLNDNLLDHIYENTFAGLTSLNLLNLSNNNLKKFAASFICESVNLSVLSVLNCSLTEMYGEAFRGNFKLLEVDTFEICCLLKKETKCTAQIPWYRSCADLLETKSIKMMFYLVSVIILLFNFASVLLHTLTPHKLYFTFIIISVNLVDIFMCLPLIIIWATDISLTDYVVDALTWKSSPLCHTTFGVNLTLSFLSPATLSFLSFSRMMIIVSPLYTKFKHTSSVIQYIIIIFSTVAIICAGITTFSALVYPINPTGLCSPLVDPTNLVTAIKTLTLLVAAVQFAAIAFITVVNFSVIVHLEKTQEFVKGSSFTKHRKSNLLVKVTMKVMIGVVSCISCWVPSGVIFLTAVFSSHYPMALLVWTTVTVVPINSIVNPTVFVAAAVKNPGRHEARSTV